MQCTIVERLVVLSGSNFRRTSDVRLDRYLWEKSLEVAKDGKYSDIDDSIDEQVIEGQKDRRESFCIAIQASVASSRVGKKKA